MSAAVEWWVFRVVCPHPIPRAMLGRLVAAVRDKTAIIWRNELLETIDAFDSEGAAIACATRHAERTNERCVVLMTAEVEVFS